MLPSLWVYYGAHLGHAGQERVNACAAANAPLRRAVLTEADETVLLAAEGELREALRALRDFMEMSMRIDARP